MSRSGTDLVRTTGYDGKGELRVMHGNNCVAIDIEGTTGIYTGLVFTPDQAEEIAIRLIVQAADARRIRDDPESS